MCCVVDFSRCRLLWSVCRALVHVLLCFQVDGAIFGAMIGVATMVHAVRRFDCVRASTPTSTSARCSTPLAVLAESLIRCSLLYLR
jgi:hypothetical protein